MANQIIFTPPAIGQEASYDTMKRLAPLTRKASFQCPNCQGWHARVHSASPGGERRRLCQECNYSFLTTTDENGLEEFLCEWLPTAAPRQPKTRQLNGYGPPREREFKLPHHHYLLDNYPGRFSALHESESHFKLLRSPDGRPVCRQHGDLRPGEVSLVLR